MGNDTFDDAAVYRLDDRTALVFTADFFTPVVDDAGDWGAISAANSLSDVYAMGGRPLLCLNLVGWPREDLPLDLLGDVLEAGATVARAAGALVVGGHTIDDHEPKYGMAVVGLVDPERLMSNAGARPGDLLVLTKPLGTGAITTALKAGKADPDAVRVATEVMRALNATACEAATRANVRAATDVTGFGLLGHLRGMAAASGVAARVRARAVPAVEGARQLLADGHLSGGTRRNLEHLAEFVVWNGVEDVDRALLCDATTSGGLLLAVPADARAGLLDSLRKGGVEASCVGEIVEGDAGTVAVEP